jgi:hypothetical protein
VQEFTPYLPATATAPYRPLRPPWRTDADDGGEDFPPDGYPRADSGMVTPTALRRNRGRNAVISPAGTTPVTATRSSPSAYSVAVQPQREHGQETPVSPNGAQVEERLRAHLRSNRTVHTRDRDRLLRAFRSVHTVRWLPACIPTMRMRVQEGLIVAIQRTALHFYAYAGDFVLTGRFGSRTSTIG